MSPLIDLKRLLYHGSYLEIRKPDLEFSRRATDFGSGFYLSADKEQADEIALDRGDLKNLAYGIINLQNIDPDNAERIRRIKVDTISDLRPYKYKYQVCLKTQNALDNLVFVGSKNVAR